MSIEAISFFKDSYHDVSMPDLNSTFDQRPVRSAGLAELWWPQNRKYTIAVAATIITIIILAIALSSGSGGGLQQLYLDAFRAIACNVTETRLKQAPNRILIQIIAPGKDKSEERGIRIQQEVSNTYCVEGKV